MVFEVVSNNDLLFHIDIIALSPLSLKSAIVAECSVPDVYDVLCLQMYLLTGDHNSCRAVETSNEIINGSNGRYHSTSSFSS